MCCVFAFTVARFEDVRDAQDALHYLNGTTLHGRDLDIQYAEGDRKSEWQVPRLFLGLEFRCSVLALVVALSVFE